MNAATRRQLEDTLAAYQELRRSLRAAATQTTDEQGFDALMQEVDRLTSLIDILMDRMEATQK